MLGLKLNHVSKRGHWSYHIGIFMYSSIPWYWGMLCQQLVLRAGISNYIPQYLWDVITFPCPWYLLLAQHSYIKICNLHYSGVTWALKHLILLQLNCLLKNLTDLSTMKIAKPSITSPLWREPTNDHGFPSQRANNAGNISMSSRN